MYCAFLSSSFSSKILVMIPESCLSECSSLNILLQAPCTIIALATASLSLLFPFACVSRIRTTSSISYSGRSPGGPPRTRSYQNLRNRSLCQAQILSFSSGFYSFTNSEKSLAMSVALIRDSPSDNFRITICEYLCRKHPDAQKVALRCRDHI